MAHEASYGAGDRGQETNQPCLTPLVACISLSRRGMKADPKTEAEIKAVVAMFARACEDRDLAAMLSLFAQDED